MHYHHRHPLRRAIGALLILITVSAALSIIHILTVFGMILAALAIGYYIGKSHTLYRLHIGIARLMANAEYGEPPTIKTEVIDTNRKFEPCGPDHCNSPLGCYAPNCYGKRIIETDAVSPYPPEFAGGNHD
jgi:hypothetical protein